LNRIWAKWGLAVDILLVLGGLLTIFFVAIFSCARSYFERGRLRGMEEAVRELGWGIKSHCEDKGTAPERVAAAYEKVKAIAHDGGKPGKRLIQRYHAELWILGDAIGEACWLQGHQAGMRRKAPAEGRIRVDLSLTDLLQLSWLAHLGFQRMMPNYRDFEIHRFSGEEDAKEGALAVSRIEAAIPLKERPFADLSDQIVRRRALIENWWQAGPKQLIA
jgi:hypothetical protein